MESVLKPFAGACGRAFAGAMGKGRRPLDVKPEAARIARLNRRCGCSRREPRPLERFHREQGPRPATPISPGWDVWEEHRATCAPVGRTRNLHSSPTTRGNAITEVQPASRGHRTQPGRAPVRRPPVDQWPLNNELIWCDTHRWPKKGAEDTFRLSTCSGKHVKVANSRKPGRRP